nr:SprT family zinc-dependent metalloprotease [Allomuricauda sp.]
MRDEVQYGTTLIAYDLEFSQRKTLGIKVYPDKSVRVTAPKNSDLLKVRDKVRKKAAWIVKQQDFFLSFQPITPPRRFVNGETHLYLGKQYRLKLHKSNNAAVKLSGGYLQVHCQYPENKKTVEELIKGWYKDKAELHFKKLFEEQRPLAKILFDGDAILAYRWMKKRWGSCDKDGKIHLNLELIKTSKKCIEYVIVHELCHLKHLNHSSAFYELLEKVYPDWKETKDKLERWMV